MYLRGLGTAESILGEPAPVAVPALPRITGFDFRNKNGASTDPENRCRWCPIELGVSPNLGAGKTACNAMELRFTLAGHRAGLEYDITRTWRNSVWQRVDGNWQRLQLVPMGTGDDAVDHDEQLTPVNNHIFSADTPGFPDIRLPAPHGLRMRLRNGVITDVDATEIVQRASYAEWVIVRDKSAGLPWTRLKFPPLSDGAPRQFVFWHSIVWLRRNNANVWVMNLARSRIRLGALSAAVINAAPV
jgi:hypothetical protein